MAQKLLLADDSITIQKVISLTFADEDFEVVCVGNGEIAIEKVQEILPDIVLADIFMPRKTGYEVCEFIKTNDSLKHIPVILLVGTFEPFDKKEAERVGADGYLTKPFETTVLVKTVHSALQNGELVSKQKESEEFSPDKTFQIPQNEIQDQIKGSEDLPQIDEELISGERPQSEEDLKKTLTAQVEEVPELEPDEVLLSPEDTETLDEILASDEKEEKEGTDVGGHKETKDEMEEVEAKENMVVKNEEMLEASESEEGFFHAPQQDEFVRKESVPEESEDILDMPDIGIPKAVSSDDDILGVFELIHIDDIINRYQKSLKQEMQPQGEATSQVAVQETESIEDLLRVSGVKSDVIAKIAKMVIEKLSEKTICDVVWEVVPDLAEVMIKREIKKMKDKGEFK